MAKLIRILELLAFAALLLLALRLRRPRISTNGRVHHVNAVPIGEYWHISRSDGR